MAEVVIETYNPGGGLVGSTTVTTPDPTPEQLNTATLRQRATSALAVNATYLAIGSPTNVDVVAQVRALTRQNNAVIRLLLASVDPTQLSTVVGT